MALVSVHSVWKDYALARRSRWWEVYLKENDALMVRPCREKEFLSIKVPSEVGKRSAEGLRIYSLAFVTELFKQNGWEMEKTYHMTGQLLPELNAAVFRYRDAKGD